MKRQREKMPKAPASGSKTIRGELLSSPSAHDSAQSRLGVMSTEGCPATVCDVKGSRAESDGKVKEKSSLSRLAQLSINESTPQDQPEMMDFNDRFPDEILVQVFKHVFRPENAWESAKVCKRWHVLQAINLLHKRSNGSSLGGFRCMKVKKRDRSGRKTHCDGTASTLKLQRVESEWRLSMQLLQSCKRHIHGLEIKNCTHISQRGYQLISAFATNLKSVRLEFCNSLDDASFDLFLDNCPTLRSVYLTAANLTLVNLVGKAPRLQDLHVHGCPRVTVKTLLSVLHGLTSLRSLSLTAMGGSAEGLDGTKFESGPPLKLQHLHLENSLSISDRLLRVVGPRLVNLRKLDLTLCTSITDDGLKAVLTSCGSTLTSLILSRCRRISDESIVTLTQNASKLQIVSFSGCAISDNGMKVFMGGKFVPRLRNLCLACCSKLTDTWLLDFASHEAKLAMFKTLDLQTCTGISAFGLKQLPQKLHGKEYNVVSEKKNVRISE